MAETEIKKINGRTVCDQTARDSIPKSASDIGADPAGAGASKVTAHNISLTAHADIRVQLQNIADQLNAFLNVDDETRNELSEVLDLIDANEELIASITTNKVNVKDIIDNLTTNVSNKPLSAAQGVALKKLIDELQTVINNMPTSERFEQLSKEIVDLEQGIPTHTSQLTNDSGFLTDIDTNEIVDAVLLALGTPVFGTLDEANNIILTGELAEGTYTLKYEDAYGEVSTIGTIEVEGEPTYTNVLPLSVNTDGSDYKGNNGEDGYKVDYRYSESSNGEKSASGSSTTGYIAVSSGDIIYLKNVTMNRNNATTQCAAYMFSSLTATGTARVASSLDSWNEPVWDSEGNLLQFKVDAGNSWKYVRLNASYIGTDSIITVNEPID